jgi:hypothetical protein
VPVLLSVSELTTIGYTFNTKMSRVQTHPQPQPLASTSQLIASPSNDDGIPKEVESDLRVAGCMMIQEAGVMLGLYVLLPIICELRLD